MKKTILLFAALLIVAFFATWTWFAKFSESSIYFNIPKPLYGLAEKWHGCEHQEPFSMPDHDTAIGISFSVMIHKNQINPWGTIWRNTTVIKFVKGEWVYAGGGGSPKGGVF